MTDNIPRHIAIIPDGNRRWAKQRGLKPWEGHEAGAQNIEKLTKKALDMGVECISFWGSSLENLTKRSLLEKNELLSIYERYFEKLKINEDIHKNKVQISVIGRWQEQFPHSLKKAIEECLDATAQYDKKQLNFFLAYSGDDEMVAAVQSIIDSGEKRITKEVIKMHLMTENLPAVDYLIRTGGEPHLSVGFMMWDIANAQLYFSPKYFPDFGANELEIAIEEYTQRKRRHGG